MDTDKTELYEYQEFVRSVSPKWLDFADDLYRVQWAAGELAAEAGEVMGEVIKLVRKGQTEITDTIYDKIVDELGDALWGVAAVANELGVSLDEVMAHNIDKLVKRENAKATA